MSSYKQYVENLTTKLDVEGQPGARRLKRDSASPPDIIVPHQIKASDTTNTFSYITTSTPAAGSPLQTNTIMTSSVMPSADKTKTQKTPAFQTNATQYTMMAVQTNTTAPTIMPYTMPNTLMATITTKATTSTISALQAKVTSYMETNKNKTTKGAKRNQTKITTMPHNSTSTYQITADTAASPLTATPSTLVTNQTSKSTHE